MSVDSPAALYDIDAYIRQHQSKDLLHFITCGSVDDGKSSLIGRLLYDTKLVLDDQMAALEDDSKKVGTQRGNIDLALLVDGLQAEREQGITIDVAYRFFSTEKRNFIVADTPGHEQYTRNMVTGASTAELAILLIDARKGILTQTRRHSLIAALLGIKHVVLAVNKMDLVDWDQGVFLSIAEEYTALARQWGITQVACIPLSALTGDNVVTSSEAMPWYRGPALLPFLETVDVRGDAAERPFRLPVQWINRPNLDFRGYAGTIAEGRVAPGDQVTVLPSGQSSRVARIVTADGDLAEAVAGQSVVLTIEDELDISRGDVLARDPLPLVTDQLAADVVWMGEEPLLPGRSYLFRVGTAQTTGQITSLRYQINVNTGEHQAVRNLAMNGIGRCHIGFDRPLAFDPYRDSRLTGAFIIIDRLTNATVGAGMIDFSLRRAGNIGWQSITVAKAARAAQKNQKPCVLWFTGLSGSGKSAVANCVEAMLHARGRHTYLLDGDNVRHGLSKDLGFTAADRVENIRRVGEVAKLFVDAGLIVLAAFISPFRSERLMVRDLLDPGEFVEIHMSTSLAVCEQRDVKGLYKRARRGDIKNFTGIDAPYEAPEAADIVLDGASAAPEELARQVIDRLEAYGLI